MRSSSAGPAAGLVGVGALLAALNALVGVGPWGATVGVVCGLVLSACVAAGLARFDRERLGPADVVTLLRAVLACGVAALVTDSVLRGTAVTPLAALAAVALVLDAVDGRVARWTRTTTRFGGRFDGEVDAFLIAVLTVHVAQSFGWWVLTMGAVRYVFGAAGWVLPWMRGELLPFRFWRKVVTAAVGIVLVAVTADVLPRPVEVGGLAVAFVLLAETFGRDVVWLCRHRRAERAGQEPAGSDLRLAGAAAVQPAGASAPGTAAAASGRTGAGRHRRPSTLPTMVALLLVWVALVAPDQAGRLSPPALLRVPLEGLVLLALALVTPGRARRPLALVVGTALFLVTLLRVLDIGFFQAFDRPFDLASDRGYLDSGIAVLSDSVGRVTAVAVVAVATVALVALAVGLPLAVGRLLAVVARHRRRSLGALATLAVVYALSSAVGLQLTPGVPVASRSAGQVAVDHVQALAADAEDQRRFDAAVQTDRFRKTSRRQLLSGLRGKDVLLVFVESYGRVALEDRAGGARLRAMLDAGTRRLGAQGYSSASAFLTSSTFGGLSWLAHGSLQSGLWVDNQRRYDQMMSGNRLTLSRAFAQGGWRTVAFLPSGGDPWPEGERFYRLEKVYGRWDVGYRGPRFGFSKMPDQFALEAVHRLELGRPDRRPVMAEIDLASSHEPWAKVPRMVPWSTLGDGSQFEQMAEQVEIPVRELWADRDDVRAAYARSIRYSMRALLTFLERYGDDDTVLLLVGDHQPGTAVSGHRASRDVPVTIVARDAAVVRRMSDLGWQDGLRPGPRAPVWRMDAFRDRFFSAFTRGRAAPARP